MKVHKLLKKCIIVMLSFVILIINPITSNATGIDDVISGADDFIKTGQAEKITGGIKKESLKTASDFIYSILLAVGIGVALIWASILGIKFMMGSVEEQAKVKEMLIPFIIGCVIVFGAFGIWKLAVEILSSI